MSLFLMIDQLIINLSNSSQKGADSKEYSKVGGGIIPWKNLIFSPGKPDQKGEIHLAAITFHHMIDDLPSHIELVFFCDML